MDLPGHITQSLKLRVDATLSMGELGSNFDILQIRIDYYLCRPFLKISKKTVNNDEKNIPTLEPQT